MYFGLLCFLFLIAQISLIIGCSKERNLVKAALDGPENSRQRLVRLDSQVMRLEQILFWMAPFFLLFLAAAFVFVREVFNYVFLMVTMLYILILQDFAYRHRIVKLINR